MIIAGMAGTGDIMQSTDAGEILSLLAAHKYALAAAFFIGLVIRLLKSDVDWFFTMPATFTVFGRTFESKRVKPWIVVALGVAMVICEKLGDGASWGKALGDGFVAVVLPIVGHQLGIESLRGGKELPIPKPPSGPGMTGLVLVAAMALGCFGKGAKSPELSQREIARGAVQALAWGTRLATEVCARAVITLDDRGDGRADELYETCATGWDVAHAALLAADSIIDAREAWDAGKVACLASRSLDALDHTMSALDKVGAKLDDDIRATIDDGVKLGQWLVRLAPGGACPMPAPKPAPAATPAPAPVSVSNAADAGDAGDADPALLALIGAIQ